VVEAIGVDLRSGHGVEVGEQPDFPSLFVNSSIEQFTRTLKAIADRFPYYDREASDEELESVAVELLDIVRDIDPEAAAADGYWQDFADSAALGDLSTEDILETPDDEEAGSR